VVPQVELLVANYQKAEILSSMGVNYTVNSSGLFNGGVGSNP